MVSGPVGIPLISAEENTPFLLGGKSLLASLVSIGSSDHNDDYYDENDNYNGIDNNIEFNK